MNGGAGIRSPFLDEPWRRLTWIAPLSVLVWATVLFCFSALLERTAPPPPELKPVEAQIIELPPPVAGLKPAPAAAPSTIAPVLPKPRVRPHIEAKRKRAALVHHPHEAPAAPLAPPSPYGTAKSPAKSNPPPEESATGAKAAGPGAGLGSDSAGARAIYAPLPKIPDELRENAFQAVAVVHFKVSYDGKVSVSLPTPTSNPRLNEILLETFRQWRFFPAMRDGIAIDSQFDVRVPIAVR
jgi:periplasmic protein TonB